MIQLTIDNRTIQVSNGETILEAARENNISIPTLCYHEALEPYAACRLCVVELGNARGKLVAACTQKCEDGMKVLTNSPAVQTARRMTAEMFMASGAHLPLVRSIAEAMGVERTRFSLPASDCILCGLCVRACDELVGAHAISLAHRGLQKKPASPFGITSAACIGCGTCVLICPTGAITFEDISPAPRSAHDARTCRVCGEQSISPQFADIPKLFTEEVQSL